MQQFVNLDQNRLIQDSTTLGRAMLDKTTLSQGMLDYTTCDDHPGCSCLCFPFHHIILEPTDGPIIELHPKKRRGNQINHSGDSLVFETNRQIWHWCCGLGWILALSILCRHQVSGVGTCHRRIAKKHGEKPLLRRAVDTPTVVPICDKRYMPFNAVWVWDRR